MEAIMDNEKLERKAKRAALPKCRFCHRLPASRPRGLCSCCYFIPEVRCLFPPDEVVEHVRHDISSKTRELPPERTLALPGTEEKLQVMVERDSQGFQVRHPDDVYFDWDGHLVDPVQHRRKWA